MKKIFVGVMSIFSIITYAQNQRFSYEYKFVIDSIQKNQSESEIMFLNVFSKGSQFYSKEVAESDSIMEATIKKQANSGSMNINLSGVKSNGKVRYQIEKSYPDYSLSYFNKLGSDEYLVQDSRNQNWKILPDKEKIGDLMTQKATCSFAGRKWTAWFTTEIPIQDGPYKFHGLPGLIVKLEDQTKSHVFELKGVKKLTDEHVFKSFKDKNRYKPLIVINETKFKKVFLDNRDDPNKSARSMISQGMTFKMTDPSGKEIDMNQMMKDREKKQKEANKRNNNVLELDLLQ